MNAEDAQDLERFAAVFDYYAGEMPVELAAIAKPVIKAFGELEPHLVPAADLYVECRKAGSSPRLSLMLASKRTPTLVTDSTFLAGRHAGDQFADGPISQIQGMYRKKVAESLGKNVDGMTYIGQLADFPGDPDGWVSGRADVEKVLRKKKWASEGSVTVTQPELPPEVKKKLPKPSDFLTAEDLK